MDADKHTENRTRFTRTKIPTFVCPDGKRDAYYWDADTPGLGVRARPGGSRQYVFQARLHGKALRVTIGPVDAWAIDEARGEARRLRVMVDSGIHPNEQKREQAAVATAKKVTEQRAQVTVGDAWPVYLEARKGDWSDHHLSDHHQAMQQPGLPRKRSKATTKAGPLWSLHDVRLADLTAEQLQTWIETERKSRPTFAALAFRLLRAFLTWCSEHPDYRELVTPGAILTKAVRRAVPKPNAKTDALQREQLAPWFKAVRELQDPVIAVYLQALLLTGARRNELAGLRWDDVDFKWRSLTIADKVEGERVIPLPPYLAQLLTSLPRRNEWVFSSPVSESGQLKDPNRAHLRAVAAAGLPHLTLHGLRRSFGSLTEWVECPVGIVAQIQGHKPSALAEKHYRRRPLDLLRMWHTKIEGWILEQAGIDQPSEEQALGLHRVK